MPILSFVIERMGYTPSCVGINLGDPPQLIHSVVYSHKTLASLKYCYTTVTVCLNNISYWTDSWIPVVD